VELLNAALKDGDENVRQGAAEVLGRLGDARAVEPLTAALGDNDASVRSAAVRALGKLGNPAVELLITALKYSD
jgi:HEAT repeat protein